VGYRIEGWEVMVNTWGEESQLRDPTPEECLALDRYFATPASRNADGSVRGLLGDEVDGIPDADIITYPAASQELPHAP